MTFKSLEFHSLTRSKRALSITTIIGVAASLGLASSKLTASAVLTNCTTSTTVNCLFGGFEIDGNVPSNGSLDWTSTAVKDSAAYTNFYDLFNSTSDDIMSQGSKESDQTTWSCVTNKAPGKADLGNTWYTTGQFAPSGGKSWAGSIWFENTHAGFNDNVQYLFGDMQRFTTNGDVHLDFEFNKATTSLTGNCDLPERSQGDVLITFDTSNGGAQIFVSAFKFICTTSEPQGTVCPGNLGSFALANNLVLGSTFDGTANISPASSDPNVDAGAFGEAGLNLTSTIGAFTCGEFGKAYMKTRSAGTSDIANGKAEVKDFTTPVSFNPGLCPSSSISKAQKDVTKGDSGYNQDCSTADQTAGRCAAGAAPPPETVSPGDTIEYKLTYTNAGPGPAPAPVIQDTIPSGTAYVASSQSCPAGATCIAADASSYNAATPCSSTAGSGTITKLVWCLASTPAGSVTVTFRVTVNSSSATAGTVTIENFATVADTGETTKTSNYVAIQVTYNARSGLHKKEADVQPNVQYCNTATGGAASSNAACASVLGAAVNPTFVDGPISVTPGDVIEYQLTYTNTGNSPATNVVISDSIPSGATFVAGSAAGDNSPTIACLDSGDVSTSCSTTPTAVATVTWTYASVAVNGTENVTFKVKLDSAFANGTVDSVSNSGSVSSDQDSTTSNTVVANVTATGVLGLIKTASVAACVSDATKTCITYTIKYFNTGNGNLTGVTISDVIPAGLTYVSCGGTPTVTCGNSSGTVTWTVDAAAGTSPSSPAGTLTLVVQVS